MARGGQREGAGRPRGEGSVTMRVPSSMVRAAQALQAMARGEATQRDIAEIMIAINSDGRTEQWGGIIGSEEIARARRAANNAAMRDFAPALIADAEDLNRRAEAVGCGKI